MVSARDTIPLSPLASHHTALQVLGNTPESGELSETQMPAHVPRQSGSTVCTGFINEDDVCTATYEALLWTAHLLGTSLTQSQNFDLKDQKATEFKNREKKLVSKLGTVSAANICF